MYRSTVGLISIIYGLAQLLPNYSWLRWTNTNSAPFPVIPFQDSPFYLGQLNRFVQGKNNFGSSVLIEHANDGYVVGSSYIFWLWGSLGRIASWNVIQTYLVMTLLTGTLTFLAMHYFVKSFYSDKVISILVSVTITFGVIKFSLGRPSPTQLCIWLAFFALGSLIKLETKKSIGAVVILWLTFITLIFTNPMYAILVTSLSTVLILVKWNKKSNMLNISALFFVFCCLLYSKLGIDKSISNVQLQDRFGFIWDRLPGAAAISIPAVFIGALSLYIFLKIKINKFGNIFALMIAVLVTVNSQVVTGIVFEMESHISYVAKSLFLLGLIFMLTNFISNKKVLKIVAISTFTFLALFQFASSSIIFFNLIKTTQLSKMSILITRLQESKFDNKVIMIQKNMQSELTDYIPIYTKAYLYWNPTSSFAKATDLELLERYACAIPAGYKFSEFESNSGEIYVHKFSNDLQYFPKWNKIRDILKINKTDLSVIPKQMNEDFAYLLSVQKSCTESQYKFRLDYIVDSDYSVTPKNASR